MRQASALARLAARLCGRKADSVQEAPAIVNEADRCRFCGGPIDDGFCFVECSGAMREDACLLRLLEPSMRPRSYFGSREYLAKRPPPSMRPRSYVSSHGHAMPVMATRRPGSNPSPPSDQVRPELPANPPKPTPPPNEIFRKDHIEPLKEMIVTKYIGRPESDDYGHVGNVVRVDERGERPLDPRHDLRNHSPTGFAWGYFGSGPAQLALAILADVTGDDAMALRYYQQFKFDKIAMLARGAWEIDAAEVRQWLEAGYR
jgi:hypothetical protein